MGPAPAFVPPAAPRRLLGGGAAAAAAAAAACPAADVVVAPRDARPRARASARGRVRHAVLRAVAAPRASMRPDADAAPASPSASQESPYGGAGGGGGCGGVGGGGVGGGAGAAAAAAAGGATGTAGTAGTANDAALAVKLDVVRKQMEFWFSPSNLRRDWYLRRQMDEEGWLDPAVFLKFNRMKQLNVSLPELVDACKDSSVLEVSAPPADGSSFGDNVGQTRIRRSSELPVFTPEESTAEAERSLVAEGVPAGATRESIRAMFLPYGNVTYTWVSRSTSKDHDLYAIVSFEDSTSALTALDAFLANPPTDLPESVAVKSKTVWDAMRARERNHSVVVELSGLAPSVTWREVWNEITDLLRPLDLAIVYFLYKNGDDCAYITLSDDRAAQTFLSFLFSEPRIIAGCEVIPRILEDNNDLEAYWQKASTHMLERKKKQERYVRLNELGANGELHTPPRGVVISLEGIPPGTGWRRLMSELRNLGSVVFLNYPADSSTCFVRLKDAETAASVVEDLSEPNPVMLLGTVVTATVLEGEEEEAYWRLAAVERRKKKADKRAHGSEHEGNGSALAQSSGEESAEHDVSVESDSTNPKTDDEQTATTMGVSESMQQSTHSG